MLDREVVLALDLNAPLNENGDVTQTNQTRRRKPLKKVVSSQQGKENEDPARSTQHDNAIRPGSGRKRASKGKALCPMNDDDSHGGTSSKVSKRTLRGSKKISSANCNSALTAIGVEVENCVHIQDVTQ